jgi:uncharacterized membrane protein
MKKLIAILSVAVVLSFLIAPVTFAALACPPGSVVSVDINGNQTCGASTGGPSDVAGLVAFLAKITSWLFFALIFMAIVFIIIGGFTYISSKGEAKAITTAKNYIIYALVGVAVGVLAKSLVLLVCNILDSGASCKIF